MNSFSKIRIDGTRKMSSFESFFKSVHVNANHYGDSKYFLIFIQNAMNLFALDIGEQQQQLQHHQAGDSSKTYGNNTVNKTLTFPKRGSSLKNEKHMTTNNDGTNSNLSISSSYTSNNSMLTTSNTNLKQQQPQGQTARILVSKTKTRTGLPLLLKNSINN